MSTASSLPPANRNPSFFLRAGTNIHANQWAIHREATLYPDPESFRPERWLEPSWPTFRELLIVYPNLQNFSAFGFGRRICPGQNIAERSLNIGVARIAWGCDIRRKEGWVCGEYDYTTGFNVQPRGFGEGFELKAREGKGGDGGEGVEESVGQEGGLMMADDGRSISFCLVSSK
jgi:hypothetical protein